MSRAVWDTLLAETRSAHCAHAGLSAFCPFPDDIRPQPVTPFAVPAARLFAEETGLTGASLTNLQHAFHAAGPHARWRETYKGTNIGQDFMDRYGCYGLIGADAPFRSDRIRAWMIYMPAGLHYTWHHHPAEEAYYVIAGRARFFRKGHAPEWLGPGALCLHDSNQPHAMETEDSPVLAYVIWRNGFDILPSLTPPEALA